MQKARRHAINALRPLVSTRFQVLFTPLFGVLFTFPSRYWFTIGLSGVFSLTRWCWQIPTGFLRSRGTQDDTMPIRFTCTGLSPLSRSFPPASSSLYRTILWSYNPDDAVTSAVWALSRSLATTWEIIIIFSSYAYLDVSVQRVRFSLMTCLQHAGLPHSEIHGSNRICRSPVAYRSLSRPS